jgi:GTP1/Obg family GTP-binding protein
MGKKKEAQVMKEQEGSGFSAGKQPASTPASEVGIQQQKQETKQEPPKPKTMAEMNAEELEKAVNEVSQKYKDFADIINKISSYIPFLEHIAKYYANWSDYYVQDFQKLLGSFVKVSRAAFDESLKNLSVAYTKKKLNIQI